MRKTKLLYRIIYQRKYTKAYVKSPFPDSLSSILPFFFQVIRLVMFWNIRYNKDTHIDMHSLVNGKFSLSRGRGHQHGKSFNKIKDKIIHTHVCQTQIKSNPIKLYNSQIDFHTFVNLNYIWWESLDHCKALHYKSREGTWTN